MSLNDLLEVLSRLHICRTFTVVPEEGVRLTEESVEKAQKKDNILGSFIYTFMPELPEVETVKRGLQKALPGRIVTDMVILAPGSIGSPVNSLFLKKIKGSSFFSVSRIGKFLRYDLSHNLTMLQHLRMSGQMLLSQPDFPWSSFLRAYFTLDNGMQLRFNDQRRFGRLWFFTRRQADSFLKKKKLGPEPLSETWNFAHFYDALRSKKARIKSLLLNQQFLSGLGNIYVDEALFAAKIKPTRLSNAVKKEEAKKLYAAIREVLKKAIKERGTSIASYRDSMGRPGNFVNFLHVYKRRGQACMRCHKPIVYLKVGQRGTHCCEFCQK